MRRQRTGHEPTATPSAQTCDKKERETVASPARLAARPRGTTQTANALSAGLRIQPPRAAKLILHGYDNRTPA
ncbi:MAG: hypothetical protein ACYCSN_11025 [Acidobacteriaceae bacterium]